MRLFVSRCVVAVLVASTAPAVAQSVGAPGNPEVPNPAAAAAPSTKATPDQLLDQSASEAAQGNVSGAVKKDVTALRRGPLLIHGNYCGIGNRPGTPPIDLLDEACMHHDACTKTGQMPDCACNDRLRADAVGIAEDPRTPADLKVLAATMAASMVVLICK